MNAIFIAAGAWLVAVILLALILNPVGRLNDEDHEEIDETDDEDSEIFWEPSDDDEVEGLDPWGRTPDWNWPRGWGEPRSD